MMTRKILLLTADCLQAWHWQRGKLSSAQSFARDTAGIERFSIFLKHNRGPAYLLTDLSEEDFRLETLPRLSGRDRRDLIQRKIVQLYRDTPFRQALQQQRPQDQTVLFTALTDPSLVSPWLDIMLAGQTELAGIFSIPIISTPLVADIPSRHLLLVSRNNPGGLRQTYFDDKLLRFSRLTAIYPGQSLGASIIEEAGHTRLYLLGQNLLPPDQVLDVHVICHANERPGLESSLSGNENLRYSCVDLQELGKHLHSGHEYADSDATPLFLHMVATLRCQHQYAAPADTRYFHLSRLRRNLHGASALLAACSLLWSAINVMAGKQLVADASSLIAQTHQLAQQAGNIRRNPVYPLVTTNDMKTAVVLFRKLAATAPEPAATLAELSMVLNDFPRIQVARLAWQAVLPTHAAASNTTGVGIYSEEILLAGEIEKTGAEDPGAIEHLDGFRQALYAQGFNATEPVPLPKGAFDNNDNSQRYMLKINRGAGL